MGQTMVYVSNAGSGDISCYRLDTVRGELCCMGMVAASGPAMSSAVSVDGRFLYVSIRNEPYAVETFAIDSAEGGLASVGRTLLPASMTSIALDRSGGYLLGASYHGDVACVMKIGGDGVPLSEPVGVLHPGVKPHAIWTDLSNRFLYIPTLGRDIVAQYRFDSASGMAAPNSPFEAVTPKGSGPRHMVFSPDGRYVFVLGELDGRVYTFELDGGTGVLRGKSDVSIVKPDGRMWAADIQMRPDGGFVYASERTGGTVTWFRVEERSGELGYEGFIETEAQPRGMGIDGSGGYLVVCGERSDFVSCYGIDADSGELQLRSRVVGGNGANWVSIVSLDG